MSSDPDDKPPESSGSIEVVFSGPTKVPSRDTVTGVPAAVPTDLDSAPVSSGRVRAVNAGDQTGRSQRMKVQDVVGSGVEKLGSGIETIGEGVSKLGDATRKVPIVGSSVSAIGEGISSVGEVMSDLPRVARTRRGRLLLRSIVVGFLLVFGWIAVIVGLQLHGNDTVDFRPDAERILVELAKGGLSIDEVYEQASPRFQEITRKEQFVDTMADMNATVGTFREITAINDTLVTTGPTGRIGRVSLTAAFEHATCHGSVSFHYDQGTWKLLGIGFDLPPELHVSQAAREKRIGACINAKGVPDPMDAKACDLHQAANKILEQLRDGHAGDVYDQATQIFRDQEDRGRFIQINNDHLLSLGKYQRIVKVTEAKEIAGTAAAFDAISQFEKFEGVRTSFAFTRESRSKPDGKPMDWQLRSIKVVVPVPRAEEQHVPPDAR